MTSRTPITAMLVAIILCLFTTFTQCSNTSTSGLLTPIFTLNATSPALPPHAFTTNATRFATLGAPLYRIVTPGDAWVFPSSANDLGARDMSCECFNPGDQCCIAESSSVAPFCMPTGNTCCGNTFCVEGESCCGEFCCAANTICNLNLALANSGCCHIGTICSGLATCYDHASSNCSNQASPLPQCCPSYSPFCRNFQPYGLGCYASSTTASSTSSLQAMTAAGTSNVFASPVGAESPSKSASVGSESGKTTYALEPPTSLATATAAVRKTSGSVKETKIESSSFSTSTTSAMTTSSSTSIPSAQSTSAITSPSSSSSIVALCYDPAANSHSPCPTTTATTSASASHSTADFNPPGASIVKSQAGKLRIPLLGPLRDLWTSSYQRVINDGNNTDLIISTLLAIFILLAIYVVLSIYINHLAYLRLLSICRNDQAPRFSRTTILLKIILLAFVAVALRLLFLHAHGPYSSHWTVRFFLAVVAVAGSEITVAFLVESLSHLPKDVKEAMVKTWLRDECGYSDVQVRGIMAGPGRRHDLNPDLDLETEKMEKVKDVITIVQGSAKPLLEKKVVGKGDISVVKGSARPWVKGRRTHSLWEGRARAGNGGEGVGSGEVVEGDGGVGVDGVEGVVGVGTPPAQPSPALTTPPPSPSASDTSNSIEQFARLEKLFRDQKQSD